MYLLYIPEKYVISSTIVQDIFVDIIQGHETEC